MPRQNVKTNQGSDRQKRHDPLNDIHVGCDPGGKHDENLYAGQPFTKQQLAAQGPTNMRIVPEDRRGKVNQYLIISQGNKTKNDQRNIFTKTICGSGFLHVSPIAQSKDEMISPDHVRLNLLNFISLLNNPNK